MTYKLNRGDQVADSTTAVGRRAEAVAATFLEYKGCQIIARNWRTRYCEIDIIAERSGVVYFCEVKYRSKSSQGSGIDYITPAKLRRMRFAAKSWVHRYNYLGAYQLSAFEVSGLGFRITNVISDLG